MVTRPPDGSVPGGAVPDVPCGPEVRDHGDDGSQGRIGECGRALRGVVAPPPRG